MFKHLIDDNYVYLDSASCVIICAISVTLDISRIVLTQYESIYIYKQDFFSLLEKL